MEIKGLETVFILILFGKKLIHRENDAIAYREYLGKRTMLVTRFVYTIDEIPAIFPNLERSQNSRMLITIFRSDRPAREGVSTDKHAL